MNPQDQAKFQAILQAHNFTPQNAKPASGGWYDKLNPPKPASTPASTPATPNVLQETAANYGGQINDARDKIVSSVTDAAKTMQENAPGGVSKGGQIINEAKAAGEGGLGAAAGAVQAIFAPISAPIQTLLAHVDSRNRELAAAGHPSPGSESLNTPEAQQARNEIQTWAQQHPELARTLGDAFTVGTSVIGSNAADNVLNKPVSEIAANAKNAVVKGTGTVKDTAGKIVDAVTPTSEEQAASETATQTAAKAKTAQQLQGVAEDWKKPTTVNKPAFNNARAILDKSPETPQFLAEQGLNPSQHVDVNGRYTTEDTATALRDTAAKMSTDTLRPSLQMADYVTPKTPIDDIKSAAIAAAKKDPNLTAGSTEAVIRNINKEADALSRKHGDGMSLTDMHDGKITYAKNGGYNPAKSPADNNIATANRSIASAFQKLVEDKAPADVPVRDFNSYLAKYYKGADYLDSLNTKIAPISVGKQIARSAAKFGGAAMGGHFGGGIVSEFAGYQIGKALEHVAENLTNPMRASFLDNLEKTNPAAFSKVQEYLRAANSGGKSDTLRLPAATSQTPIRLGPDTTTPAPSIAPHAAKTQLPVANPKTGRMTTVYTSSPK